VVDARLFVLRAWYSAQESTFLSRVLLFATVYLVVQLLMLRRGGELSPAQRVMRARGPWILVGVLVAWGILLYSGYQGPVVRGTHLEIAQSAPARVSYGDAATAPLIQVFTAPGCGPCKYLEGNLKPLIAQGYAVQYIPASLSGDDWDVLNAALCEADPRAGFERVFGMSGLSAPAAAAPSCRSGVSGNEAVLRKLAGSAVFPTVIMPDGFLMIGAPSDAKLLAYLHAAAPLPPATGRGGQPL
jgi:hypothetical protein